ncbi:MAG: hypothetical protein WDN06_09780 [Asticcacaulis sp.]
MTRLCCRPTTCSAPEPPDIKAHVTPGDNVLRILFRSPITEGLKKLADFGFTPPATNDQSENGGLSDKKVSVFTRKAGYHYGWDWGPRFVTSGLWRPAHVRAWDTARIDGIQIVQSDVSRDSAHRDRRLRHRRGRRRQGRRGADQPDRCPHQGHDRRSRWCREPTR